VKNLAVDINGMIDKFEDDMKWVINGLLEKLEDLYVDYGTDNFIKQVLEVYDYYFE